MSRLTAAREHLDQHVARDVRRVDRAGRARGTERTLRQPAVLGAGEDGSPVLELVDVAGRFAAEDLDRVLVAEIVGALDRVEGVDVGVVLGCVSECRVDAALGGAGVASRRVQLRDDGDIGACVVRCDRGAHAGAAGPDHHDIVLRVHQGKKLPNWW
jgi:hypothetical protein